MKLGVAQVPTGPWAIMVRLPLRIVSEKNERNRWARIRRTKEQREVARMAVASRWQQMPLCAPLVVTLTRIAPRMLDSDNSVGGLSAVRDGVAKAVGIDDGDRARIAWHYAQRVSSPKAELRYGVEILIEERNRT